MSRPLIGVTGPDTWLPLAWWFIAWAVRRSGGRPLRMTPRRPREGVVLDGLVISGGDDIDPRLYLEDPPDTVGQDFARDRFELRMIRQGLDRGLPLLGICRGAQLLNVVSGGSLHPDVTGLRRHTSNRRNPFACKDLLLEPDSRLGTMLGASLLRINSLHHQAIDRPGRALQVVGRDRDDLVQAVEDPAAEFLIGVQWHPEYLPTHAAQRRLFQALVRASA